MAYREQFGVNPKCLTFSLAALISFYKTNESNDLPEVMEFMKNASVDEILAKVEYWDTDLSFLSSDVNEYYNTIQTKGMKEAFKCVL